jgi:chemotaxis family two-component system sensor kinase Cph1
MQKTNYDSDFCGSLPIHLTNLIQSYGILLVVEQATGKIIQASENCDQVFNVSVQSLVNTEIQKYIGSEAYISLQEKFARPLKDKIPAVWQVNGVQVLSLIHRRENHLLIEINIEPITSEDQETFLEVYQELKYAMSAIESSPTVEEACKVAAAELKRISGFDKVMIYRFDKEWNGTVLAEVKEDTMESYFGFTFPASDIPQQARQLYLRNPYRFIPDCNYQPVKLYPVINPMTKAFIDLSDCNIRSVAAVHIEYLKNMNVAASMSTRILKNDKLWGLIACHHRTAKNVSYAMCSIFEILSGIISIKISSLENQELHENETRVTNLYTNLIEAVYKSNDLDKNTTFTTRSNEFI